MKRAGILVFIFSAAIVYTASAQQKAFKTDPATGVQYRFIKHNKHGAKGSDTNIARAILAYSVKTKSGKDSDEFNSRLNGGDSLGALRLNLKKTFYGCLEQGILMMSPGDSAEFLINADSLYLKFFKKTPDKIPAGITGNTLFKFRIRLISFMTKKEVMEEAKIQKQKMMKKVQERKMEEPSDVADYLKKNNYNVPPDADGIYYLQVSNGTGRQVNVGDSLEVHYKGTLLDGTVFDPGTQPIKLKYAKNAPLIRGWISILGKMHEGEKVKVMIPSTMGYGPHGNGMIQPYTPLIFELELVRITPGN